MGVTTCVTTWCLSDEIDSKRKMDTTLPATQVGPRPVKSGLGGHEAGLFGVDEGITNSSPPIMKRGRMVMSKCPTFGDFFGVWNDVFAEKRNYKKAFTYNDVSFAMSNTVSILPAVKEQCGVETLLDSSVWFDDLTR